MYRTNRTNSCSVVHPIILVPGLAHGAKRHIPPNMSTALESVPPLQVSLKPATHLSLLAFYIPKIFSDRTLVEP
jgi:hypothetical protein